MDWHIRVIEGPDKGLEQLLQLGPNIIGRGKAAALRLTVEAVSWEHAVLVREQDQCFLENLSALGTWVGDARVNGRVRLRPGDKIRLSEDTVLRVDAAGAAGVSRGVLITALVVMLLLLGVVGYYEVLSATGHEKHWESAYIKLVPWMELQVKKRQLPPESLVLFREAWRHSVAKDWQESEKDWLRSEITLASPQARTRCMESAEKDNRHALNALFNPPPPGSPELDDDDYAAALGTFVNDWLSDAIDRNKSFLK